jgi:hypothetical protein
VTLAILKLCEEELLQLDMSGINDYFKSFKNEENGGSSALLPPIETIIDESFKIKIPDETIDLLSVNYKENHKPNKKKKGDKAIVKLSKIKEDALEK